MGIMQILALTSRLAVAMYQTLRSTSILLLKEVPAMASSGMDLFYHPT